MKSRLATLIGVFLVLLALIFLAARLEEPNQILLLITGAAIVWAGQIVSFYFRKKEEG
ncbi:MAG: hypothetical protein Q8R28_06060 [Dehalococcoidia bacterium]|nr:hypothetical protein [Dehalococcoidia bacterium]